MMPAHTERDFEDAIEISLIESSRYAKGKPAEFDPSVALFPDETFAFLRASQPGRWAELEAMLKERTAAIVLDSLVKELQSKGALGVLRHGFKCYGKALRPAKVSWSNEDQLRFVLREGKKRQIRRMCELVGLKVIGLKRVRIGRIPLSDLPLGQWRYLRDDERF